MALGNANTSAQARGKNKPVIVKRRKEVVLAKSAGSIVGSRITGESSGASACALAGSTAFDQEYFTVSFSGSAGAYIPNAGSKVYTRRRINDRFALPEGVYLIKVDTANYAMIIRSDSTVQTVANCSR